MSLFGWRGGRSETSPTGELTKLINKVISFRDLAIHVHHDASGAGLGSLAEEARGGGQLLGAAAGSRGAGGVPAARVVLEQKKLAIIMVGLPGRGKTFVCNKLKCYLNWLGHPTAHFNVGQYRRSVKEAGDLQDADFFDHANPAGRAAREHAFHLALADMMEYLDTDAGQVAIFDATNSTQDRRDRLAAALRGRVRFVFIENILNDQDTLARNYLNKMMFSPDYNGVPTEQALDDFMRRIAKYEEVYEAITDRAMHYIKLTDMVTGRGHIDINRISGYLPGKIVFFLMQVCKGGMTNARRIWLTRHGESAYNQRALIGGDSGLSPNGQLYADVLPEVILSRLPRAADGTPVPVSVWTSTLRRTIQTAAALPFAKLKWKALDEIDAGICDGLTYAQIAEKFPAEYEARKKDKLRYRYPRGESYLDMIQRLEPVISEMEREGESIVIVGHQAVLRVIFGYLMARPQDDIPSISIPLHTVIELTPRPDGTMGVEFIPVPVHLAAEPGLGCSMECGAPGEAPAGLLAAAGGGGHADAAMEIAEAIAVPRGGLKGQAGRVAPGCVEQSSGSGASLGDVPRMSSCSSSSTLAAMAAGIAAHSSASGGDLGAPAGSSGVAPQWRSMVGTTAS